MVRAMLVGIFIAGFRAEGGEWGCTFMYCISFLLVNSPIRGAVAVSMNFLRALIPVWPEKTSCSPSDDLWHTMLGMDRPSSCARFGSVVMPKVNLSWLREANDVKVDFRCASSLGRYAMNTASSADLKAVMFFLSNVEIIGRVARFRNDKILG